MHGDGKHIIEMLTVEVNVPDLAEGFRIKDNVASFVDSYVIPAIERYLLTLEQDVPPGRVLRIDRLQVELVAPSGSLENGEHISATVAFELEEAFRKSLEDVRREQRNTVDLPADAIAAKRPGESPHMITLGQSARLSEAFLHFIERGTRPWWISRPEELDNLLSGESLKTWEPAERVQLAETVTKKLQVSSVRQRLVRQLTDEVLIAVLQPSGSQSAKTPKQLRLLEEFLRLLEKEAQIPVSVRTRERTWELLFSLLPGVPGRQSFSPGTLLDRLERKLPADYPAIKPEKLVLLARTFLRLAEAFSGDRFPEAEVKAVSVAFAAGKIPDRPKETRSDRSEKEARGATEKPGSLQQRPENRETTETAGASEAVNASLTPEAHEAAEAHEAREAFEMPADRQHVGEDEHRSSEALKVLGSEGVYVDNAGLVILHPFLKHLFLNSGQMEGSRFVDPVLAVHMLHYLATGKEQAYEHEMLFEKYLVGIPAEESIPRMVPLGEALREEIGNLLDALKQNWPEMEHSSHDAIRETFLQRSGKLIPEEPHPRLVVERKTVDILMDRLGWAISIVRFPWKDDLLYVEW